PAPERIISSSSPQSSGGCPKAASSSPDDAPSRDALPRLTASRAACRSPSPADSSPNILQAMGESGENSTPFLASSSASSGSPQYMEDRAILQCHSPRAARPSSAGSALPWKPPLAAEPAVSRAA